MKVLSSLTGVIEKHSSESFGTKPLAKKRKFSEITDKSEDEQLAIAIAASMKKSKIEKLEDDNSEIASDSVWG